MVLRAPNSKQNFTHIFTLYTVYKGLCIAKSTMSTWLFILSYITKTLLTDDFLDE